MHFVHQLSVGKSFYHSIMMIGSYFEYVDNETLFRDGLQTSTGEVSSTQVCVARELSASMQQKEMKKKRQAFPEDIKQAVYFYASKHGDISNS